MRCSWSCSARGCAEACATRYQRTHSPCVERSGGGHSRSVHSCRGRCEKEGACGSSAQNWCSPPSREASCSQAEVGSGSGAAAASAPHDRTPSDAYDASPAPRDDDGDVPAGASPSAAREGTSEPIDRSRSTAGERACRGTVARGGWTDSRDRIGRRVQARTAASARADPSFLHSVHS